MKKLTKQQANALYYIQLDGGLMRTINAEQPFTTFTGRSVHAATAKWLADHGHLTANEDGLFGDVQSWRVTRSKEIV